MVLSQDDYMDGVMARPGQRHGTHSGIRGETRSVSPLTFFPFPPHPKLLVVAAQLSIHSVETTAGTAGAISSVATVLSCKRDKRLLLHRRAAHGYHNYGGWGSL